MKQIIATEDGRLTVERGERRDRDVVTSTTHGHEKRWARIGVTRAWCGSRYGGEFKQSYARSVASLISDVHSPFDYYPVHARWDVVY